MKTTATYLPGLTPLRGIAALLVLVFHSSLFLMPLVNPAVIRLIGNGWLWVDFFFVLSGFILSHVYGKEFQQTVRGRDYKQYLLARFARVYPLHLVTLLYVVGLAVWLRSVAEGPLPPFFLMIFDYQAIPSSLLLVQALHLHETAPLNTVSWSLSAEWWMYVLFPVLVSPFFRLGRMGKGVVFVLIAAGYGVLMYYIVPTFGSHMGYPTSQPSINTINDFALLRCALGFLLGMLFYELYRNDWAKTLLSQSRVGVGLFLGLLLAMHLDAHQLLIVAFFPLVILAAAYNTSGIQRAFRSRPLQRLGDWSFAIYMVHIPLVFTYYNIRLSLNPTMFSQPRPGSQSGGPDYLQGWLMCLVLIAATLLVAALVYRYVEVPARHWLKARLAAKRPVLPVSEPVVAEATKPLA